LVFYCINVTWRVHFFLRYQFSYIWFRFGQRKSHLTGFEPLAWWQVAPKMQIDLIVLGAVHKRRPQSGGREWVCPVRTFFGKGGGGFFKCGYPNFLAQKTSDFSKFMVCQHGHGWRAVEPVWTFCRQGGKGINFLRFCADVFYGRPFIVDVYVAY